MEEQQLGPIERIQAILSEADKTAMCIGFAVVAEWLEADGQRTVSLLHTDQALWHLHGLLQFALDNHVYCGAGFVADEGEYEIEED